MDMNDHHAHQPARRSPVGQVPKRSREINALISKASRLGFSIGVKP
jgi:hypothetical protein